MKRLTILGLAIAIASSAAGAAFAQGAAGGLRQACGADVAKLCPDAQPGGARRQCMIAHRDQLSETCKSAIIAAMAAHRATGQTASAPHN